MKELGIGARLLGVLALLCGVLYPLLVWGLGQLIFPTQADGSLIRQDGVVVGSRLLGQNFSSPGYFWGRPSATAPFPYNPSASAGSNLGPSNPELARQAAERVQELGGTLDNPVPADLVSASGSGLDPHISPAAAFYQVERVAAARGIEPAQLVELIRNEVEAPFLGLFGAERVNVLELNLELDRLSP